MGSSGKLGVLAELDERLKHLYTLLGCTVDCYEKHEIVNEIKDIQKLLEESRSAKRSGAKHL